MKSIEEESAICTALSHAGHGTSTRFHRIGRIG